MEEDDEAEEINLEVFEQKLEEIFNTSNLKVNQSNLKNILNISSKILNFLV
ncbi:hypothetical protein CYANOKiyG1_21510 [Okeania sp. KiyG1]|nr:hypothetical protein CYANOKiyG1_21510 [Okeania sp. KiyG1]